MYCELIKSLSNQCEFNQSASTAQINNVEAIIGVILPDELKDLLKESNGIIGNYGCGIVWSIDQIRDTNIEFRTFSDFKELYMPFNSLLFFADSGNGDQFAFVILDGEIRKPDIYLWNHENDSRTWAASNLRQYFDFLLNGKFD